MVTLLLMQKPFPMFMETRSHLLLKEIKFAQQDKISQSTTLPANFPNSGNKSSGSNMNSNNFIPPAAIILVETSTLATAVGCGNRNNNSSSGGTNHSGNSINGLCNMPWTSFFNPWTDTFQFW